MAPLIQAENGSELTKEPKPFARDKDPLYLHSSYAVHNGMAGIKAWNKKFICCISRPDILPFKKQNRKQNTVWGKMQHIQHLEHEETKTRVKGLF